MATSGASLHVAQCEGWANEYLHGPLYDRFSARQAGPTTVGAPRLLSDMYVDDLWALRPEPASAISVGSGSSFLKAAPEQIPFESRIRSSLWDRVQAGVKG